MESEQLVNSLRDDIVKLCKPLKIVLFSRKQRSNGEYYAVKFCVIIPEGNARLVERRLYVEIESELAFDVLVYTAEEWKKLLENAMSFAAHIECTGRVLYAAE